MVIYWSNLALQLLEKVGVLSRDEAEQARSQHTPYQDSATASPDCSEDNNAALAEDGVEDPSSSEVWSDHIGRAIYKVNFPHIACAVA
jgi:hypothetical protein